MMADLLAYCGILCSECPAYKATVANNDDMRRQTANEWSVMYSADISPEQVNCLGCKSELRFAHCGMCEIRKCALVKKLDNCGLCASFACELLDPVFKSSPEIRDRLEKARQAGS